MLFIFHHLTGVRKFYVIVTVLYSVEEGLRERLPGVEAVHFRDNGRIALYVHPQIEDHVIDDEEPRLTVAEVLPVAAEDVIVHHAILMSRIKVFYDVSFGSA